MYSKGWEQFAWEENVQKLGMPHFYLGKHSLTKLVLYFYILFPALIFLGIGSVISIIVFICEKVKNISIMKKLAEDRSNK